MKLTVDDLMRQACVAGGALTAPYDFPSSEAQLVFNTGENLECGYCDDAPYCPDPPVIVNSIDLAL